MTLVGYARSTGSRAQSVTIIPSPQPTSWLQAATNAVARSIQRASAAIGSLSPQRTLSASREAPVMDESRPSPEATPAGPDSIAARVHARRANEAAPLSSMELLPSEIGGYGAQLHHNNYSSRFSDDNYNENRNNYRSPRAKNRRRNNGPWNSDYSYKNQKNHKQKNQNYEVPRYLSDNSEQRYSENRNYNSENRFSGKQFRKPKQQLWKPKQCKKELYNRSQPPFKIKEGTSMNSYHREQNELCRSENRGARGA
jgi:hypothetical protein